MSSNLTRSSEHHMAMDYLHPDLHALFDLDCTLVDYDTPLMTQMTAMAGPGEPPLHWDKETWPEYAKARSRAIKAQVGWWRRLPRLQLGFDIWEVATDLGYRKTILSRGPKWHRAALTEKGEWCDEHVPGTDVALVYDKSCHYGKLLCDDWPEYFLPWLRVRPRGWVVAVEHPWNKDVEHPRLIKYNGTNIQAVIDRMVIIRDETLAGVAQR